MSDRLSKFAADPKVMAQAEKVMKAAAGKKLGAAFGAGGAPF